MPAVLKVVCHCFNLLGFVVDEKRICLLCCSGRQLRIGLMDAQQRRPKSNRKCSAESRSLDTGTKRPHLQGKIGYPGYFTSLIIPKTPRNPITCQNHEG